MLPQRLAFLRVEQFSWVQVLDILIVALIIYQLLQFIRGTHAVQIAVGTLLLVVFYWISQLLNLETVNWLLRTFLPYVVFGLIVIFQAEIRKGLAHLGKTPLLGAFSKERPEELRGEFEAEMSLMQDVTYMDLHHPWFSSSTKGSAMA